MFSAFGVSEMSKSIEAESLISFIGLDSLGQFLTFSLHFLPSSA